ncbi:hypothetical protein JL721_9688 [Aureococcus anophagefferens]|nr:hypothetical protein JL721_9688 [Aureococcus anophagefferens]
MPWESAPAPAPREEVAFSLFPARPAEPVARADAERALRRVAEPQVPRDDLPPRCRGGRDGPQERFEAWSLRQGASPPPPPPPPPRPPPRTYDRGPSHYAVLGVAATATDADVRRAYRKLARETNHWLALAHHPDRHARDPGAATAAAAAMATINEAYGVLSDPRRRGLYDVERRVGAVR